MELPILKIWNEKEEWFRDLTQANRVASVVIERLADDRIQEECRYLMRLKWHFYMGYQEVSYSELEEHISRDKMALLDELFDQIAAKNYDGIVMWVERCESELPVIEDRWLQRAQAAESDYPHEAS